MLPSQIIIASDVGVISVVFIVKPVVDSVAVAVDEMVVVAEVVVIWVIEEVLVLLTVDNGIVELEKESDSAV